MDREEIQRGLNNLPDDQRTEIDQRAREHIASLETRYPRLKKSPSLDEWDDAVIDQMVSDFAELPCPALDSDGSCRIYEARPLACRTMGIPTEEHQLVQGACEVQTFIPIRRVSQSLLEQEQELVHREVQ
ncbi:MAG TPA: YkgJ family cysteine cluster protein, partial [Nitrospiraceae bacterium]